MFHGRTARSGRTPNTMASVDVVLEGAYIETTTASDAFVTRANIVHRIVPPPAPNVPPQQAIAVEATSERWEQLR